MKKRFTEEQIIKILREGEMSLSRTIGSSAPMAWMISPIAGGS